MLRLLGVRCFVPRRFYSEPTKALWGRPPEPATGEPELIELTVNGTVVKVPPGTTIMQAAAAVGVDVPRFCYHERLKIAGNCRMCLVQVNGGAKLMASCAAPAAAKMKVETDNDAVKKAREGVMEFILANHPLDCPICDQGGECDLQEQAMAFGSDRSRFRISADDKRAVSDKNFGPLVKTSMNRCIQCTRCVRFAIEVAGIDDLGTTGRGSQMEIGTYIEKTLDSELSGNVIDLCPVGALTSKPYAFMARPWELRRTESIDVMDAVGASIRVDSRGPEVLRILPRLNEAINEEWLGDKSRFACDGLRNQRLTKPLIRQRMADGRSVLVETDWEGALLAAATRLRETSPSDVEAILGPFVDMESVLLGKEFLSSLGVKRFRFDGPSISANSLPPNGPLTRFNPTIVGLEQSDSILILGSNPRIEAPLLNARIRKAFIRNPDLVIGYLGKESTKGLTYNYENLGSTLGHLRAIKKSPFWSRFISAKRPVLIVGQSLYDVGAYAELHDIVKDVPALIQPGVWNGYGHLALQASRTGARALGWGTSGPRGSPAKFIYLLGADELEAGDLPDDAFVLYQGHHGDRGAQLADLVLPSAAYTEKEGSWMNMEGRVQRSRVAVPPPGDARPDWQIIRALAEVAGINLPYDSLQQVQEALSKRLESFNDEKSVSESLRSTASGASVGSSETVTQSPLQDYYLTDCISRASPTMAACSRQFTHKQNKAEHLN